MGRGLGSPAGPAATFGLPASRPPLVAVSELRRLEVGHPHPAARLALYADGEHQPVLQALMALALDAPPAERVGEKPGEHGRRREATDDAVIVYRLAAERHERRFEVDYQMALHR